MRGECPPCVCCPVLGGKDPAHTELTISTKVKEQDQIEERIAMREVGIIYFGISEK